MVGNISFNKHSEVRNGALPVREAGRRGGLSVLQKYGRAHFVEIGTLGQRTTRNKYPGMAPMWGKKGGRPRKSNLNMSMGEQGTK